MSTLTATTTVPLGSTLAPTWSRLKLAVEALGEGYRAYRRYEHLRARGVSHAVAAARSFEN
jgi:hypothetical protein